MSTTPYFFMEYKTSGGWEPVLFKITNDSEPVELFPFNGAHEVFDILTSHNEYPEFCTIKRRLPSDVTDYVRSQYLECDLPSYNSPRYFYYADMMIYLLKHPTVKVFNEITEQYEDQPNPLFQLNKRIEAFLEVWDTWEWEANMSTTRIIYWFT